MICGIYRIRNIKNGKVYPGSSKNVEGRWKDHIEDLKNKIHHCKHLEKSWYKHGEDCFMFEVLEECELVKEVLLAREQFYLDQVRVRNVDGTLGEIDHNLAYNTCAIAGNRLGSKATEETKKRMSEARKGEHCGEKNPMWGRRGAESPHFGKKHSEETKKKIAFSHFGIYPTEETRKKLSEAKRGEKHPFAKLTWEKVREIREKYKTGNYTHRRLGKDYAVDCSTISYILNDKTWIEK